MRLGLLSAALLLGAAALEAQIVVTLQPGERAEIACAGQLGAPATVAGIVSVPCEPVPPPPQPGTVVPGDSLPLPANGAGVLVHQSAGLLVGGPGSAPRVTADGAYQVDDRAGGRFDGLGCTLDAIEVYIGGDYRGFTDGAALMRVYGPTWAQVTNGTLTPTPGWQAVSVPLPLTSADPVQWRRLTFSGAARIPTQPGMVFVLDWQPKTNDFYNLLVVRLNQWDGVHPWINDGVTLRATQNGLSLASPAFRVYEAC